MNIFNKDGWWWWVGVVENRKDPLKLGRCQVRIIGYHTDNKEVQPTSDLPWAMPMQPITSAAISGKGTSPIGPVEGSWVIGFFIDGADQQQPVIMGTFGGAPKGRGCGKPPLGGYKKDESGNLIYDGDGNPVPVEPEPAANPTDAIQYSLPPLTKSNIQQLMDALGRKESGSIPGGVQKYSTTNTIGFVGKYQFGAAALQTLGYLKAPIGTALKNSSLTSNVWAGKRNLNSLSSFFANGPAQEAIMFENINFNYKLLIRRGVLTTSDPIGKAAGLLAVSHLLGAGGAIKFSKGVNGKDAYGTDGNAYYRVGSVAVGGGEDVPRTPNPFERQDIPNTQPAPENADPAGKLNDPALGQITGFEDPNSVYPKCDYSSGVGDTNKLSTGDAEGTIVETKNSNIATEIATAADDIWNEPPSAFCAQYPYNHVKETESGHIVEFDDTPGHERIHIYHRTGTYIEIDVNGTSVRKVVGDNYEIFERNNKVFIRGQYDVTVDGAMSLLVKGDANINVQGDVNATFNNNVNMNVATDFNLNVGGKYNVKANSINVVTVGDYQETVGGDLQTKVTGGNHVVTGGAQMHQAGGNFDVRAANTSIDGGNINMNSGTAGTADPASPNSLGAPSEVIAVSLVNFPILKRAACNEADIAAFMADGGEGGAEAYKQKQIEEGVYTQEELDQTPVKGSQDLGAPVIIQQTPVSCEEFRNFKDFPDTIKLSKYYTLGMLSSKTVGTQQPVIDSAGLTRQQIVCNLKALAVNCLDPIKARYPEMYVASAFRTSAGDEVEKSQHEEGLAADIQFTGLDPSEYYELALWIRDNIAYDQLLLEYKSTGSQTPWIHISFNPAGNRAAGETNKISTLYNHSVYSSGLVQLA